MPPGSEAGAGSEGRGFGGKGERGTAGFPAPVPSPALGSKRLQPQAPPPASDPAPASGSAPVSDPAPASGSSPSLSLFA